MRTLLTRWHTSLARSRYAPPGFLERSVTLNGREFKYQVYVPASANAPLPVILFLHGAGERGNDGLLQVRIGLPEALRKYPERYPFLVVIPQCRQSVWWVHPLMISQAETALEASIAEFNGDRKRLYVTGISMGGYGSWAIAARHPGKFAAIAPVCGGAVPPEWLDGAERRAFALAGGDAYAELAARVGALPAWLFHGELDEVIPVAESRRMAEALKSQGNEVRYTEYPGLKHDSWTRAYAEPEFPRWLLEHSLDEPPDGRR